MRVDVDSHFMGPVDWFEADFPQIAAKYPPYSPRAYLYDFVVGDLNDAIPGSFKPDHPGDVLPGVQQFFDTIPEEKVRQPDIDPAFHLAEPRLAVCDKDGIDVQLFNTQWGYMPYLQGVKLGRMDLARDGAWAYNTWAGERAAGHTDRLIPIVIMDLDDVDWALAELRRTREAGSRTFHIRACPANDRRSLVHPDHERFWSACEDLGMAMVFHTGPQGPSDLHPGWFANGGDPAAYGALHHVMSGERRQVQIALAALLLDGVFERHPRLALIIEELGMDWLPPFLEKLDRVVGHQERGVVMKYKGALRPSEYVQRQVRVSALAGRDHVDEIIDRVPPGVLIFSTDYPHPEGAENPIQIFENQLDAASADEAARASFWGDSAAALLGLSVR